MFCYCRGVSAAPCATPLRTLRTGIARHLEAVVDTPSQIAGSGLNGIGLYPRTHLGYGNAKPPYLATGFDVRF